MSLESFLVHRIEFGFLIQGQMWIDKLKVPLSYLLLMLL